MNARVHVARRTQPLAHNRLVGCLLFESLWISHFRRAEDYSTQCIQTFRERRLVRRLGDYTEYDRRDRHGETQVLEVASPGVAVPVQVCGET